MAGNFHQIDRQRTAQTTEPPGHKPLLVNILVLGPFEEEENASSLGTPFEEEENASSLGTTQVHCKPLRTSGLLLHEQPHRRSDARTSDALTD